MHSPTFLLLTTLLLLASRCNLALSQRLGQPIHKFFTNPLVNYPGGAEINFVASEIRRISLPHPVIFGPSRTAYNELFLHKLIPGFVFFNSPNNIPPYSEDAFPRPYIKLLNDLRGRNQDEVKFFVRSVRIGAASSCVDRKFANLYKDAANQVFNYPSTGYFSPQSITAVTFRQPTGQAVGRLAEIVFVNSGIDTVSFVNYGGVVAADAQSAGFYDVPGSSGSLTLPPRFVEQSNMAESGSWSFRLSHPSGIASANVDQSIRRILDMNAQTQGFLSDRLLGCPCSLCDSRAQCLSIGVDTMRAVDGFAKCCRCQGLNSYLGNGFECADTGTPLPVTYPSIAESGSDPTIQINVSVVQTNLDVIVKVTDSPSNPSLTQKLIGLVKLSEPVWANMALLTATALSNSTQNLFALGDVFKRRVQLTATDESGSTRYAVWTIEQTVWNRVLMKATNTSVKIDYLGGALSGGIILAIINQPKLTTRYEFTTVTRNLLRLESRPPTNFTVTVIPADPTKMLPTIRIEFADTWELSPTCQVETRVGKLLLERNYELSELPTGSHLTRLVGNVARLRTCAELACGTGSECIADGPAGQARCQCLDGYRRGDQPDGACRPICGPALCHPNAECLINKCICASGYSGDGLRCEADSRDCRLPQAACRPEDGFACMQQATRTGVEYRCQCGSSKCIREADAACRQQAGCSQFANCQPGANGSPGTCSCRQGFRGNGRVCLPEMCADNATCADAGAFAFCNASRLCDTCPPPKSIAAGRCQTKPCRASDCSENAQCDTSINACVCRPGFAANRLGGCSIACRSVQDCNKDVLPNDVEILNTTMECLAGVCQCRQSYTVDRLDRTTLTLTCTNCDSDAACLRGSTCQTDVRLSGVRLCKCPAGKVGDGKTACDECQPGQSGSSPLACGSNAQCENRPGGRVCRCQYGYSSANPKTEGCTKDDTLLMISNQTEILLYEGQTDIELSCRVLRGPVRADNLVWTSIRDVPLPVGNADRVVQFVLNDRKVLRFSRVVKSDAKEYHCLPDVVGEYGATLTVNVTVLDNPCSQCHARAFCNYSRPGCQCNRGFSGDGVNQCTKASCAEQQLCDPDTELCLYSGTTGSYTCQCAPGMERVQGRCQRRQEACTPNSGCHVNAECALVDGRRQCRCREGFSGDGKLRCERDGPGCNFYNQCVKNSECKYSELNSRYRCVCTAGYFGKGDTSCRAQISCATCQLNAGTCEQEAIEHRSLDGRVEQIQLKVCRCPPGTVEVVTSSGATLCRTGSQINRTLYVAQGDAILQMPADDSQSESGDGRDSTIRRLFIAMSSASAATSGPEAPRRGSPVIALDYNCNRKQLVWSVYGHPRIYSANTADSARGGPVSSSWVPFGDGLEKVEGLAVDWQTGNVYYTAQYVSTEEPTRGARFGEIGVVAYRQGVANKRVLLRGLADGVVRPRGIAVDPFLGKIYYSDWDRSDPRIMMVSMNGANHAKLVSTGGPLPNDLIRRLDSRNEEVCYTMAELPLNRSTQNVSLRRESGMQQVAVQCVWRPIPDAAYVERSSPIRVPWSGEPFGLAYANGEFYWTNWLTNQIVGHNINSKRTFVRGPLGSLDNRLMGVAVANSGCPSSGYQAQSGEHPCAESRGYGDCKYICLAAPNQGVNCVCPDGNPGCNPYVNRPTEASRAGVKKALK